MLLLLEMREPISSGLVGQESLRALHDRYNDFMRAKVSDLGARPVCTVVTDVTRIAALLTEFRAQPVDTAPFAPTPDAP